MILKKLIFAILCLFSSSVIAGNGPYDGIWHADFVGFFSVHERSGTIIVARLSEGGGLWEAYIGQRNGAAFRLETIQSPVAHAVIDVTMTSDTTFTAVQESCRPTSSCLLPDGAVFNGTKVW